MDCSFVVICNVPTILNLNFTASKHTGRQSSNQQLSTPHKNAKSNQRIIYIITYLHFFLTFLYHSNEKQPKRILNGRQADQANCIMLVSFYKPIFFYMLWLQEALERNHCMHSFVAVFYGKKQVFPVCNSLTELYVSSLLTDRPPTLLPSCFALYSKQTTPSLCLTLKL